MDIWSSETMFSTHHLLKEALGMWLFIAHLLGDSCVVTLPASLRLIRNYKKTSTPGSILLALLSNNSPP